FGQRIGDVVDERVGDAGRGQVRAVDGHRVDGLAEAGTAVGEDVADGGQDVGLARQHERGAERPGRAAAADTVDRQQRRGDVGHRVRAARRREQPPGVAVRVEPIVFRHVAADDKLVAARTAVENRVDRRIGAENVERVVPLGRVDLEDLDLRVIDVYARPDD